MNKRIVTTIVVAAAGVLAFVLSKDTVAALFSVGVTVCASFTMYTGLKVNKSERVAMLLLMVALLGLMFLKWEWTYVILMAVVGVSFASKVMN